MSVSVSVSTRVRSRSAASESLYALCLYMSQNMIVLFNINPATVIQRKYRFNGEALLIHNYNPRAIDGSSLIHVLSWFYMRTK